MLNEEECPIDKYDLTHLILHIIHERVKFCLSMGLGCMGLPLMSTSSLVLRGCRRDEVYRLYRAVLRTYRKLNGPIEIFKYKSISAYLKVSVAKGTINLYKGYVVSEDDCKIIQCTSVSNVKLLYLYLVFRILSKNLVRLNVMDAVMWIAKLNGIDYVDKILDFIHDYVESSSVNVSGVDAMVRLMNIFGLNISQREFIHGIMPARRILMEIKGNVDEEG